MTEEVQAEPTCVKSKQYLLMVDEMSLVLLKKFMPCIQFVQVEGFNIDSSETHMALVTPKPETAEKLA